MSNERIAVWMGDTPRIEYAASEQPDTITFSSDCRGDVVDWCNRTNDSCGRSYVCRELRIYPAYDTDPAAALRVLARMAINDSYTLRPTATSKWVVDNSDVAVTKWLDTPCAAICAAWESKFGGEA